MITQVQEQKHVTGVVESGNMKLNEFYNKDMNDELPFDVVDDIHFHMIDDDAFYRKHYMPCMDKIKSETDEKIIQGHIKPMVNKCVNHYINKYDIPKTPEELLNPQDRSKLIIKIKEYEKNPPQDLENDITKSI